MFHNNSQGQKLARLKKEYLPYEWTSDAKIWMIDVQGSDILSRNVFHQIYNLGSVIA